MRGRSSLRSKMRLWIGETNNKADAASLIAVLHNNHNKDQEGILEYIYIYVYIPSNAMNFMILISLVNNNMIIMLI